MRLRYRPAAMAYVRTRLGRLYCDEQGETGGPRDPAILLLHGLLFDGGSWRGQIEPLADLGRVVNIDGPGHGRSEPAPRFMLEEHADALIDVLDEFRIDRAILVGISWGGMVAMRFAIQHPRRVAGLALLDTSADAEALPERLRYRALVAIHRRVGVPLSLFDKEIAPRLFAPRTIAERPELVQAAYRRAMGYERDGLARAAIAVVVRRRSIVAELSRIDAPALVMCGRHDRSQPPARSETIAKGIRGARLVVLEELGHMSALEGPAQVNAHLVPFVRSCFPPRGQS